MSSYLIAGTSRGLGLGLVKVLVAQPVEDVKYIFATTRSAHPSPDLADFMVDSPDSNKAAASHVSAELEGAGLDYLINNAAALDTNVLGTHETMCAFLPLLREGGAKKIVNFSSTLGAATTAQTDPSIVSVPYPTYKISKAGTHMLMALWSNRLKDEGFCVWIQSPGNLRTDLAGNERADLPAEVGAKEVVRIAQSAGPGDTGRHRNIYVEGWEHGGGVGGRYDGEDLPW
ncbi:Uu.00g049600.m01.CDS01 [Anthostomella pinea]|uniref:Uu.00g049600.m01.CDS01 n=1 Tax=Anthostomella pinea TaxID=933095 RepID=A0AAI8VCN7_9PEZI|nr:Uu.00g049600.m01.CDS01 [Anthostomella pinea]